MTMANTENTREKKTIRKRARPLKGAGGTVTEEAKEKRQTIRDTEPILHWVNMLSNPWFLTPTSGEPNPRLPLF